MRSSRFRALILAALAILPAVVAIALASMGRREPEPEIEAVPPADGLLVGLR